MKRHSPAMLAAVLFVGLALTPAAAQAPNQLFGTWKLNLAKSKFSPGPPPKSMTIIYSPAGFGMKIVVDLVPAEGKAEHWEMRPMFDGAEHPVTGNPNADTISIKRISDTKGESTLKKKGGKAMSVNVRTLAPDGKSMTIETTGTMPDGKPRHDVAVYEK